MRKVVLAIILVVLAFLIGAYVVRGVVSGKWNISADVLSLSPETIPSEEALTEEAAPTGETAPSEVTAPDQANLEPGEIVLAGTGGEKNISLSAIPYNLTPAGAKDNLPEGVTAIAGFENGKWRNLITNNDPLKPGVGYLFYFSLGADETSKSFKLKGTATEITESQVEVNLGTSGWLALANPYNKNLLKSQVLVKMADGSSKTLAEEIAAGKMRAILYDNIKKEYVDLVSEGEIYLVGGDGFLLNPGTTGATAIVFKKD